MESPSPAKKTSKRGRKKSRRGAGRLSVDDLTSLSWVAGTPGPMDSSESPTDDHKKASNRRADASLKKIVLKKKLFKTSRPSYKIILKDPKDQADNDNSGGSSDCSSPGKEDTAVYENTMTDNPPECTTDQVNFDLLVDTMISSEDLDPKDPCVSVTTSEKGEPVEENMDEVKSFKKPNCSYTCLIGMALKERISIFHDSSRWLEGNFPRTRQYNKKLSNGKGSSKSKNPVLCSRCTRIVSPKNDLSPLHSPSSISLDDDSKEGIDEYRNYCYDLKEELRSCNIQMKPRLMDTEGILDASECPLRQAGMNSPPSDPKRIAGDLFGVAQTSEHMLPPFNYPGQFLPFCPPAAHYGIPVEGFSGSQTSSMSSASTSSAGSPYGSIYMPTLPLQYMMWGHYPQFYNAMFAKETGADSDEYGNMPLTPPTPTEVYKVTDDIRLGANGVNSPKKRPSEESPDVSSLNSPMKKMKVKKNASGVAAEEMGPSYLADVTTNEAISDYSQASEEEVQYGQMYWPMFPDLLSSLNYYNHDMSEVLSSYNSTPTKTDLEQIAGDSDLKTLLENSYRFLPNPEEMKTAMDDEKQSYDAEGSPEDEDCVSSLECQEMDAEVSSSQKEPNFFPSLDSLLQIGDHTIMSLNSAMLDIQNTVEVVTAEDTSTIAIDAAVEETGEEGTASSTMT